MTGLGFGLTDNHAPELTPWTGPAEVHLSPYADVPRVRQTGTLTPGNVLVSTCPDVLFREYAPNGLVKREFANGPYHGPPIVTDLDRTILEAEWENQGGWRRQTANFLRRFDASGNLIETITTGLWKPEAIVLDADRNIYIGSNGEQDQYGYWGRGIFKYAPDGTLLARWLPDRRIGHMDLAADQHTIIWAQGDVFDSENDSYIPLNPSRALHYLDVNTGASGPWGGPPEGDRLVGAAHLRILPDGSVLVADVGDVKRLNATGTAVLQPGAPCITQAAGRPLAGCHVRLRARAARGRARRRAGGRRAGRRTSAAAARAPSRRPPPVLTSTPGRRERPREPRPRRRRT